MTYIPLDHRAEVDPDYARQLRAFVAKTTETWPPFTPEQRAQLAVLLRTATPDDEEGDE